jgi:hypothetical protein
MSYDKNTWAKGDVITAAKLNNMENGIANAGGGGGSTFINVTTGDENTTLDKKWSEINSLFSSGEIGYLKYEDGSIALVTGCINAFGIYSVVAILGSPMGTVIGQVYSCNSENDYPVLQE